MISRAATALLLLATMPVAAQDMAGVRLNDQLPGDLGAPVGMQEQDGFVYRMWQSDPPLLMSVTTQAASGDVLYIEIWREATQGTAPTPISGMYFGETTLDDIRTRFGSDGLVFGDRGSVGLADQNAAFFTSYEIAGTEGVISFVTVMPLTDATQETAGQSVLDSVILGHAPYLQTIWGLNRGLSAGYLPIPDPTF